MSFTRPGSRHTRILEALMMREVVTRFGREGLGFLWLVGEPLLFCLGVLVMWSIIKPEYEHGVRLGPFIVTGYMSLLLLRHQISYSQGAIQGNIGLLFHKQISILHIMLSRNILEFMGATAAFIIVYFVLMVLGQVSWPENILLVYAGWLILAVFSVGLANVMAALAIRWEVMERIVPLLTYMLIPLSGAFFMVAWLPERVQEIYLLVPIPHAIEMIRAGVFGPFVETHYNATYVLAWSGVLNFLGLILLADARDRVDVE
ncbi:ABC transporter permease [Brevundimonas sp. PAMC22021]|uniref:ABC transporter permease n=1 Tax=Brevundimonas sp. PAMC22021 TaxID=2861285 RepID=UPI001C62CF4E|nr:ABC transporter permease [Brevundimonas sp. PAMC22021]QYF86451.1 ABC transporter permease [Brevundimonas sp. PAMC22021]